MQRAADRRAARRRRGGSVGILTTAPPALRAPARRTPRPLRPPACAATTRARARSGSARRRCSTPSSPATRSNALRCSVSSPRLVRVAQHGERALERRARVDLQPARAAGGRRDTSGRRSRAAASTKSAAEPEREPEEQAGRHAIRRRRDRREVEAPVEAVRLAQERRDAGAHLREHLDGREARVDPVRAACRRARGTRCARDGSGRRGTCRSAEARGTHGDVMQRSVHVHVTCANRPTLRRSTRRLPRRPRTARSRS